MIIWFDGFVHIENQCTLSLYNVVGEREEKIEFQQKNAIAPFEKWLRAVQASGPNKSN